MPDVKLIHGDCLEILPTLTEQVDAIITDLPYGTTACKWDEIIPLEPMWEQVKRICKGVFITTASQPFTSKLVISNINQFKCEWIWYKDNACNFIQAKNHPMKYHENIIVFGLGKITYNPIMLDVGKSSNIGGKNTPRTKKGGFLPNEVNNIGSRKSNLRYPKTLQYFSKPKHNSYNGNLHPTQKPVALYEYLIRTYTNEGDTILDIAGGSGTTAVAAIKTNRNCILIEKEEKYFSIAQRRIKDALQQPNLFHGGG